MKKLRNTANGINLQKNNFFRPKIDNFTREKILAPSTQKRAKYAIRITLQPCKGKRLLESLRCTARHRHEQYDARLAAGGKPST